MKRIVAINASPRTNWNTASLVREAVKGAQSEGAQVQVFDLYRLEKYSGCLSCFSCKRTPNEGRCIVRDGLAPVLEAIRSADGLILGTPNYLGDVSAGFRALYERLIFQNLTYNADHYCCNEHLVPVLFIMTSNGPEGYYSDLMQRYQQTFQRFIGPTEAYHCGDTLQLKDYSKTDWEWSIFDPEAKQKRHKTVFPEECRAMFEKGAAMGR